MNARIIGMISGVTLLAGFVGCLADTDDGAGVGEAQQEQKMTDQEIADSCALMNPKKVAICHVPPGNPDNAHTICIGEPAVDHHNKHHDDYIGPCDPGDDGDGGSDATTSSSSSSGSGGSGTTTSSSSSSGSGGSDSTSSSSSSSGSGGGGDNLTPDGSGECSAEYPSCTTHDDCAVQASCLLGCCVPFTN
jgi:hypothetical protein